MDKKNLTPLELIQIASQHAYSAEYLLQDDGEIIIKRNEVCDTLFSFVSLMVIAFELSLRAYLLHDFKSNNHYKSLLELLEACSSLGLANQDVQLLKTLSRQFSFRKGTDYEMWDDRQQLHIFCVDIMSLFERLQQILPLELQKDYQ